MYLAVCAYARLRAKYTHVVKLREERREKTSKKYRVEELEFHGICKLTQKERELSRKKNMRKNRVENQFQ